jgi:hypothetical protein
MERTGQDRTSLSSFKALSLSLLLKILHVTLAGATSHKSTGTRGTRHACEGMKNVQQMRNFTTGERERVEEGLNLYPQHVKMSGWMYPRL